MSEVGAGARGTVGAAPVVVVYSVLRGEQAAVKVAPGVTGDVTLIDTVIGGPLTGAGIRCISPELGLCAA